MNSSNSLYAFVFKGEITQDAVQRLLKNSIEDSSDSIEKIAEKMPIDLLDDDFVTSAQKMAFVYVAIASFENSVRKFIEDLLFEEVGVDWWQNNVSEKVRNQAERRKKDEEQFRWHGSRGTSMIYYTQMGDLANIMASEKNLQYFQPYIPNIDWARQIFISLERSRNVIMHGGELTMHDIERVSMNIRDWIRQVGV